MNRCEQSELLGLGELGKVGPGRDGMRAGLECITEFNNSSSHSTSRALVLADGLRSTQTAAPSTECYEALGMSGTYLTYGIITVVYSQAVAGEGKKGNVCVTRGRVDVGCG